VPVMPSRMAEVELFCNDLCTMYPLKRPKHLKCLCRLGLSKSGGSRSNATCALRVLLVARISSSQQGGELTAAGGESGGHPTPPGSPLFSLRRETLCDATTWDQNFSTDRDQFMLLRPNAMWMLCGQARTA